MTLVDTSIWIDHLRNSNAQLVDLLERDEALSHPMIIAELACGTLKKRSLFLSSLNELPTAKQISASELLTFIEMHKLYGIGLGVVDINIIASSLLSGAALLTLDKKLATAYRRF